jgi:hypothetical protein
MSFDFEHSGYLVTADVDECYDGYGTGDSPTLYEVKLLRIVDEEGLAVRFSDIGDGFSDSLEDEAIRIYKGY